MNSSTHSQSVPPAPQHPPNGKEDAGITLGKVRTPSPARGPVLKGLSPNDVRIASEVPSAEPQPTKPKSPGRQLSADWFRASIKMSPKSDKKQSLPWQRLHRHRKTQSLTSVSTDLEEVIQSEDSKSGSQDSGNVSPILKELWDIQKSVPAVPADRHGYLSIPSLAKPSATSFLPVSDSQRTSPEDATEWQLGLPSRAEFEKCVKSCLFVDTYSAGDCILDLKDIIGVSGLELASFARGDYAPTLNGKVADYYRPTVESLMECSDSIQAVRGHWYSPGKGLDVHHRREALILEEGRQFLCVFRGTTTEQTGKATSRFSQTFKMSDTDKVTVFKDYFQALEEMEATLFGSLSKLVEENPFYDICFTGHAFGAGLAILAGYRFALSRPELRISVLVSEAPKVGKDDFTRSANSLGNLKFFRMEHSQSKIAARSAGHAIRINPSKGLVTAYRFGLGLQPSPLPFKRVKNIKGYSLALESLGSKWAESFFKHDGAGIRGAGNEFRNVV